MANTIECVGCGVSLTCEDDDPRWSVRTEGDNVVERHISLVCPECGVSEVSSYATGEAFTVYNLIVEAVRKTPLESYKGGVYA